jgi:hypothetical protein
MRRKTLQSLLTAFEAAMRACILGASLATLSVVVVAQTTSSGGEIQSYVTTHQQSIIGELLDLVVIPNTRTDTADLPRNAALLQSMISRRGLAAEIIETAGAPLVIASLNVPNPKGTILFYAHYDGQPVDPSRWKQPSPFAPVLRSGRMEDGAQEIPNLRSITQFSSDWRLYARSASDDKAPIVALLTRSTRSRRVTARQRGIFGCCLMEKRRRGRSRSHA